MLKALFGSRVPRVLVLMIVVVATVEAAYLGVNYLQTPWARVHNGRPPLVGYWLGEMEFGPGDTRRFALHLRVFETTWEFLTRGAKADWSVAPRPDIRVAVKACGPNGSARYYGDGDVASREANRFTFGLNPEGAVPGKHPTDLHGVWHGGDRLELTSRIYEQGPLAAVAEASIDARPVVLNDPGVIRFEMRRITEQGFNAVC